MEPRTDVNISVADGPDRWGQSACILCSNGCGLDIAVKDNKIVGVRGNIGQTVARMPRAIA